MAKRFKKSEPDPVLIGCAELSKIVGPKSQREIAKACNCSRALIQQIERGALRKLRHPSRIKELEEHR